MAGTPGQGGGEPEPTNTVVLRRKKQQRVAFERIRRRRRQIAPIGLGASQAIEQTIVPKVGMLHDPWKRSVRTASTVNVSIATGLESGDSVGGVTLAAGDRVLLKNQTDAKENGIYVAVQSGAASRADDGLAGEHFLMAVVGVQEGTNADHFFVCFTNAPIIIGSTSMTWTDMGAFMGQLDGAQIQDATVNISKLADAGYTRGSLLYFDGSSWAVLDPPGAKSVLTHDGSGDPYWDPI